MGKLPEIDFLSECAAVPVPLDPSAPDGEALPVFVLRRLAPGGAARAQVWLLQGGPGDSGSVFKDLIEQLWQGVMPDVDGYAASSSTAASGFSGRLACPVQEDPGSEGGADITASEWPACIEALRSDGAKPFRLLRPRRPTPRISARLLDSGRANPARRWSFTGVSYGTTRALRFLQAHPDGADAVAPSTVWIARRAAPVSGRYPVRSRW